MRSRVSGPIAAAAAAFCAAVVIVVCSVVILAPTPASAQTASVSKTVGGTAVLSWTAPTQYTNGTNIAAGVVVTFNVYESNASTCATFAPSAASLSASNLSATTWTTPAFSAAGSYCYETTALVAGVESAPSNAVSVTVTNAIPKAPANLMAK